MNTMAQSIRNHIQMKCNVNATTIQAEILFSLTIYFYTSLYTKNLISPN